VYAATNDDAQRKADEDLLGEGEMKFFHVSGPSTALLLFNLRQQ
jgi:hypothetical protein